MNCPKCGAEIESGFLYCKECGEEIMMVPDFEPELENSMQEILFNVADDMAADEAQSASKEDILRQMNDRRKTKILIGVGVGFACLVLLLAGILGIVRFQYFSYEHQMKKAESCMAQEDYENAAKYFSRAVEIEEKDSAARFRLGEVYLELGDVDGALLLFKEVAASDGEQEQQIRACRMVVDLYSRMEDYQAISDFLLNLGESDVTSGFQKYMAKAPDFSFVEGSYETVVPLKLTSNTAGTIYYTTNGNTPTKASEVYSSPIFLESGDYVISAFFVNEFNIASEVVVKSYHIEVAPPLAPEVGTYSGDYEIPTLIEVELPETGKVYYTSDGSEPGLDSNEYTGPIHMPIGKSRFKFITYNVEGTSSEIVTRDYNLELKTNVTVSDAEAAITQGMLEAGKIYDLSGLSYEIWGRYLYRYQYVTNEKGVGDVYFIAEIYEDTEGIQSRAGALYAVGIYDGKRYRIALDEAEQYIFEEF